MTVCDPQPPAGKTHRLDTGRTGVDLNKRLGDAYAEFIAEKSKPSLNLRLRTLSNLRNRIGGFVKAHNGTTLSEATQLRTTDIDRPRATEKQIRANRHHAFKSTGPKSCVGKLISARNSTRHGFYATSVLLPDDDHDEFIRLARRLVLAYVPGGALEEDQVRIIIERWRARSATVPVLMPRLSPCVKQQGDNLSPPH